jgi:hypothetical protein
VLNVHVSKTVAFSEAVEALARLRLRFRTIPYEDGGRIKETIGEVETDVVDLTKPPGLDESCFLAAEMTTVLQRSLGRAPGYALTAPSQSGSGGGKGEIVKVLIVIAGHVVVFRTARGRETEELDKRIVAGLLSGAALLVMDNLNNTVLSSEQLGVAMTEPTYDIRPLGTSRSRRLTDCPFPIANGNGLELSNDLARRFIRSRLDPRVEDPEARIFASTLEQIAVSSRYGVGVDSGVWERPRSPLARSAASSSGRGGCACR